MITINFVALNSIRPKILKVPVNRTWGVENAHDF